MVAGIHGFIRQTVPGAASSMDVFYDGTRRPIDQATRYYIGVTASGQKMIVDQGCGEGDVRDYCEAGPSRRGTGSLAGVAPALSPWAGRTEADFKRHLVAPRVS